MFRSFYRSGDDSRDKNGVETFKYIQGLKKIMHSRKVAIVLIASFVFPAFIALVPVVGIADSDAAPCFGHARDISDLGITAAY